MRVLLAGCILLLLASACVRTIERPEPRAKAALFIGREPSRVTLTWDSDPTVVYSLQYKNKANKRATYEFLPGNTNIIGTGERIQRIDRPPRGIVRSYRLHMVPVKNPGK